MSPLTLIYLSILPVLFFDIWQDLCRRKIACTHFTIQLPLTTNAIFFPLFVLKEFFILFFLLKEFNFIKNDVESN